MYLCDLPNEVLSLVLRASVTDHWSPAKKVKENLSLLLVCKKWRSLALPYVYSEVHIEYGTWADASTEDTGGEPEDVKMTSNLDAVASVDCVRTARNLRIHVHYNLDPFPGLTRVVQTMRDAAEVWRGARVLDIAMHPNYRHPSYNANVARYAEDARQICTELAAVVPRIRRVSFGGINKNHLARGLYGRLAELYADQLQIIRSRHPITVSPDCLFKQLRKASIDYDYRDGYQHPRTDPARLEELRLLNWPANHSWTPFSTDTGAMEIELPCLKRLDLLYSSGGTVDGRPWKLHFPALRSLNLTCMAAFCPLFESMALPPRMERIAISASADALQRVSEMVLPATEHFSLEISYRSGGGLAALVAASRILAGVQGAKELELNTRDPLVQVPPESVTCLSLTRLMIAAPTSLDAMLELIRKLPNLTSLGLWKLALNEIQADISVPEPGENCVVEPLDTKLKSLGINVNQNEPSWEMIVPVVKYLLLWIPTLEKFRAMHAPKKPIMDFVGEYLAWYPHLEGIGFTLNDSDDLFRNKNCGSIE